MIIVSYSLETHCEVSTTLFRSAKAVPFDHDAMTSLDLYESDRTIVASVDYPPVPPTAPVNRPELHDRLIRRFARHLLEKTHVMIPGFRRSYARQLIRLYRS